MKSVDFAKTQKPRYLENETLFFLQTKKFINYCTHQVVLMTKNGFVVKVTSNDLFDDAISDIVVCVDDMNFLSTKSDAKVIH